MKVIRLFMAFVVVSLVIGLGSAFSIKQNSQSVEKTIVKEAEEGLQEISDPKEKDEIKEERIEEYIVTPQNDEKKEIKQSEKNNKETKNEKKFVKESVEQFKEDNTIKEQPKEETKLKVIENNQVEKEEESKQQTKIPVWEELGISEDEYYNKPIMKWQRVDFASMEECLEYGKNYEPYLNGKELFNCRKVVSYSGNYLGVMFDTEKLS